MVVCKFFNTSKGCRKGTSCPHEHSNQSINSPPTSPGPRSATPTSPSTPQRGLFVPAGTCRFYFQSGACRFRDCKFNHDQRASEPRSPESSTSGVGAPQKVGQIDFSSVPRNTCRIYFNTGQCRHGLSCKFKHDQEKNPKAQEPIPQKSLFDDSNRKDIVAQAASNALFQPTSRASAGFTSLAKVISTDNYRFDNTDQIYRFVNDLMGTTYTDTTWTYENTQEILADIAKTPGNGPLRLGDIMRWTISHSAASSPTVLSFQRGILPLIMFLTSTTVIKSPAEHLVNALYSVVDKNIDSFAPSVARAIDGLIQSGSVSETGQRRVSRQFQPESFLQVFKPVIQLFYEYLVRFNNACGEHPCIPDTAGTLQRQLGIWMADMATESPTFSDSLSKQPRNDRVYLVQPLDKDMERLGTIVQRQIRPRFNSTTAPSPRRRKNNGPVPLSALVSSFHEVHDPPGEARPRGPRHDNDHENIRDITVLPTYQELMSDAPPYLPGNFDGAPHHLAPGMDKHFDIMFRLLREDFVSPLRTAIRGLVDDLQEPKSALQKLLKAGGGRLRQQDARTSLDLNIYGNASFAEIAFNNSHDLVCTIKCTGAKKATSVASKKLAFGNLVGVVFTEAFRQPNNVGTVAAPIVLGIISGDVRYAAAGGTASVPVAFYDSSVYIRAVERLRAKPEEAKKMSIILFEVPGLMVESVRPFLESLKTSEPSSVPFPDIILGGNTTQPPLYARAPGFHYDLSCLFSADSGVKNLRMAVSDAVSQEHARTLLRSSSRLDESQAQCMIDCLTREVALVEGPPGTGKSWLGVELVRVLLKNGIKRILTLCFTNHALDQFLEHILLGVTESILRLGSRSKNERVSEYSLQNALLPLRQSEGATLRKEIGATVAERKTIEAEMQRICEQVRSIDQKGIIWTDVVKQFLEDNFPEYYDQLCQIPADIQQLYDLKHEGESDGWEVVDRRKAVDITDSFRWWQDGEDFNLQVEIRKQRKVKAERPAANRFALLASLDSDTNNLEVVDEGPPPDGISDILQSMNGGEGPLLDPFVGELQSADEEGSENHRDLAQEIFEEELADSLIQEEIVLDPNWKEPKSNRSLDELVQDPEVWEMSRKERNTLMMHWKSLLLDEKVPLLSRLRERHREVTQRLKSINDISTLKALSSRNVVGCTTTGAAKILPLLRNVSPEVLIVEEAGECLETHVLANLVPSIKHLILIGDHLQLRPHITCYNLSLDSKEGVAYKLDESLFERLVNNKVPMSMLAVQRRMRPSVADLIRNRLYPNLIDHETVKEYPDVRGVAKNVFFLSHDHREDQQANDHSSKTNKWEVQILRDFVLYLLKQGYKDIAILTPYLGQLALIRQTLSEDYINVEIDDRDAEELANMAEDSNPVTQNATDATLVERKRVDGQVVCRTVDNFQGEEAEIVILTLVRNSGVDDDTPVPLFLRAAARASIGFLKSPNRTNVALSRAKHGLYILGNAPLLADRSPMWNSVINTLTVSQAVGRGFPLFCGRHGKSWSIDRPGLIPQVAPHGGCLEPCGFRFESCGHTCPQKCHPNDEKHRTILCPQRCVRLLPCQHPCERLCSQPCGECEVSIRTVQLPCGHIAHNIPCYRAQNPHTIVCTEKVPKTLPCRHAASVRCGEDPRFTKCQAICGVPVACKHATCRLICGNCNSFDAEERHKHACEKLLHCSHSCMAPCGHADECPPCGNSVSCRQQCPHRACTHPCSQPCAPCLTKCVWNCSHRGPCTLPCGQPCSRLPCDEPCPATLKCGHPCPAPCGEDCLLQTCITCSYDRVSQQMVDLVMMQTLESLWSQALTDESPMECLMTLACGHIFSMDTLDGLFGLQNYYEQDNRGQWKNLKSPDMSSLIPPRCPHCRAPITHQYARRYGRIIKWAELDVQERSAMMRLSRALQTEARMIQLVHDSIDTDSWAATIDALENLSPVSGTIDEVMATRGNLLNSSGQIITPVQAFIKLRGHGLSQDISKIWVTAVQPLMKIYTKLSQIAATQLPHVKAYESAYISLYRSHMDQVMRGDLQVADPDIASAEYAQTSIGCPRPRADSRCIVEATWMTLELRQILSEIANAMMNRIRRKHRANDGFSQHIARFQLFCLFILESCIRDGKAALKLATESKSRRQVLQTHLRLLRHVLDYNKFQVDVLLGRENGHSRGDIADIAAKEIDKQAELMKAVVAKHIQFFRLETTSSALTREMEWIKENIIMPMKKMLTEGEDLIEYARTGATYRQVTLEEKREAVRALNFGATGHWFHCRNGHPFVIGECGGAMEESTCPECGVPIGGNNHRLLDGISQDSEFENIAVEEGALRRNYAWG